MVKRKNNLNIKPTDTYQCLDPKSCHPCHSKKSITYSQALRYNRTCSNKDKFDQSFNDLEKWLIERSYNEGMVRTPKERSESKDSILERGNIRTSESKLTFKITYYQVFQNVKSIR